MQRITITIEDDLLKEIDAAAKAPGYQNRSEIIRDLAHYDLVSTAAGRAELALSGGNVRGFTLIPAEGVTGAQAAVTAEARWSLHLPLITTGALEMISTP